MNQTLIEACDIATPHIAGYSYQGKQNGTAMAVQALARHFGWEALYDFRPVTEDENLKPVSIKLEGKTQGEIAAILQYNYPISRTISSSGAAPAVLSGFAANTTTAENFILNNHIHYVLTKRLRADERPWHHGAPGKGADCSL